MLRIRVCLSRILDPNFFHPGSRVKKIPEPGSRVKKRSYVFLTQKLFLSSQKYDPGCSSRIQIPDPNLDFLPIPDQEVKKHRIPDPDSQHWNYRHVLEAWLWCACGKVGVCITTEANLLRVYKKNSTSATPSFRMKNNVNFIQRQQPGFLCVLKISTTAIQIKYGTYLIYGISGHTCAMNKSVTLLLNRRFRKTEYPGTGSTLMNNVYWHVLKADRGVKFRSDENECRKSSIWIKVVIPKIQIGIKYRNGTFCTVPYATKAYRYFQWCCRSGSGSASDLEAGSGSASKIKMRNCVGSKLSHGWPLTIRMEAWRLKLKP